MASVIDEREKVMARAVGIGGVFFRVDDLDTLIAKLTAEGIEVELGPNGIRRLDVSPGYTTPKAIPRNCGSPPEPEDVCAPQGSDWGCVRLKQSLC